MLRHSFNICSIFLVDMLHAETAGLNYLLPWAASVAAIPQIACISRASMHEDDRIRREADRKRLGVMQVRGWVQRRVETSDGCSNVVRKRGNASFG